jgi:hypothetical protein
LRSYLKVNIDSALLSALTILRPTNHVNLVRVFNQRTSSRNKTYKKTPQQKSQGTYKCAVQEVDINININHSSGSRMTDRVPIT